MKGGIGMTIAALLFLASYATVEASPQKIQVLILTGQNNHDWRATTPQLREILQKTGRFEVRVNEEPTGCGPETFAQYDVIMTNYNGPRWGARTEQALLDFVNAGKGFVVIHAANNAFEDWPEYDKLTGGGYRGGAGHGWRHSFKVTIRDREHPITKGMPDFQQAIDEFYHQLTMQPNIHLLASGYSAKETGGTGREEPIAWVVKYGKGRVFHTVLGDDLEAMRGVGFITLVRRGTEWAATGKVTIPIPEDLPKVKPVSVEGRPVRVLVWSERAEPKDVYPDGVNIVIAEYLNTCEGIMAKTAQFTDPEQGLAEAALAETDVLIWWGHLLHGQVTDETVERIVHRVREEGMGFIALHASQWSKPFTTLMGTSCNWATFRDGAGPEHIQVVTPSHPIAEGLSDFVIPETELCADPFDVPNPDTVVFKSAWDSGETASSAITWTVGKGRVFYLWAGHETYPIYFQEEIRKVLRNAVLWVAGRS